MRVVFQKQLKKAKKITLVDYNYVFLKKGNENK